MCWKKLGLIINRCSKFIELLDKKEKKEEMVEEEVRGDYPEFQVQ